jgi:hypothetical protein
MMPLLLLAMLLLLPQPPCQLRNHHHALVGQKVTTGATTKGVDLLRMLQLQWW